jgi:hypothetical protein
MQRNFGHAVLATASLAALAAVVACGGGGGGGSQANLPGVTTQGHATFTVTIPSATGTSATHRAPAFVSPNTQSLTVAVNGDVTTANLTASSPNCTPASGTLPLTCTVALSPPAGNDTFIVTLFQGLNGTGNVLSTATISATVNATGSTVIPVSLGGVVASIDVTVQNGNRVVPGGFPSAVPVIVAARDASGATIVGPGNYTTPITLTNADTSGVTALSTTSVTSPSTIVTLAYSPTDANGGELAISGLPIGATTIGATATGIPATAISAGTFQYIADRFFGFGHTRNLNGTGSATVITYSGAGVPSPNPSTWAYNVTDNLIVHGNVTFNGVATTNSHHLYTYTQTTPATGTAAETETKDQYRSATTLATGTTIFRQGDQDAGVNAGTINSPITGNVPGTVNILDTYPATNGYQEDILPHVNGASWSNSTVPFTEVDTNAQISTFQKFADGSWTFNESVPTAIAQAQSAAGIATTTNTGFTTSIALPVAATPPGSGNVIPVAQQTTSPAPGPISTFFPVDWYPGGAAPAQPLYPITFTEAMTAIPSSCNVPAAIATQAFVVVQVTSQLDVAAFRNRQQIYSDYFVPNGVGFVCENFVETVSNYRFQTGIISMSSTVTYTVGVTNVTNLGLRRSQ